MMLKKLALLTLLFSGSSALAEEPFPQGIAVGDVTSSSALFWARSPAAKIRLTVGERVLEATPLAAADHTVHILVDGLAPGTLQTYRFAALDPEGRLLGERQGSFRTAPAPGQRRDVAFIVAGDLGGQGFCRTAEQGYAIFKPMTALGVDFMVGNGDMIYADAACGDKSPEGVPQIAASFPDVAAPSVDWSSGAAYEVIADHWRYNRADPAHQTFLLQTSLYAQWDDHEVINDFGGSWRDWPLNVERPGYPRLVADGRRALFNYNPITRHPEEKERIYRAFSWGDEVDLFLLDARSYRDPNEQVDRPAQPKTLLGRAQVEWLKRGLKESRATWKVISNDVPLTVPTGGNSHLYGRDAFANGQQFGPADFGSRTGAERELRELLTFLDAENLKNVVFVVTDVHYALSLRYHLDVDGDGDRVLFHELISGPLSAVKLPTPAQLDPTFPSTILFGRGAFFNFSYIRATRDAKGRALLRADIRDDQGEVAVGSSLEIVAEN
jgi:alkaline phosphatase D